MKRWRVEFWDFDVWDVWADGPWEYKAQAIAHAQEMNRRTSHETRKGCFGGHRFRVRAERPEHTP